MDPPTNRSSIEQDGSGDSPYGNGSPLIRSVKRQEKPSRLYSLCWAPDGDQLLATSADGYISFYNYRQDSRLTPGEQWPCQGADQLRWRPDDRNVFAVGCGRTIRLFDRRRRKQKPVSQFNLKNSEVLDMNWHPDGQYLCVGTKDNHFESFLINAEQRPSTLHSVAFGHEINEFRWDCSGRLLLLTTGLGSVQIFDWNEFIKGNESDHLLFDLKVSASNCICISFDPHRPRFAVGCANSLLFLFDLPELVCTKTFSRLDWAVRTVQFSADGLMLVSACENRQINVCNLEDGQEHLFGKADGTKDQTMPCICWHPVSSILAYSTSAEADSVPEKSIAFWIPKN